MLIGYARTSTLEQEAGLEAQKRGPLPQTATMRTRLDEPGYEHQNCA
jgi:DNA invertase Pin-like site-specific DNA recombinase